MLFNGILQPSEVIPDWVLGMIVPIHEDGSDLTQLTIEESLLYPA